MNSHITGWGLCIPRTVRTNHDLEKMVDTSDEWIQTRTGIRERRIAGEAETTFSLALGASKEALARAGVAGGAVDMIIVATITPDYAFPAVANLLQDAVGAKEAGALDINASCTGFLYGLALAHGMIVSGQSRNVLVVGAETMSRVVDWTDRATCVLFGDGAGAVVVQGSESPGGLMSTLLGSDGAGAISLCLPGGGSRHPASMQTVEEGMHYLKMDGREVYRFAVRAMADSTRRTLERAGLAIDDIDLFIPHQANSRIIAAASDELGIPSAKVFTNVERYGNTSAASIPIALCEAIAEGRVKPGDKLLMVAFGAGLSWAGAAMEWTAPVGRRELNQELTSAPAADPRALPSATMGKSLRAVREPPLQTV